MATCSVAVVANVQHVTETASRIELFEHVGIEWIIYVMRCCICRKSLGSFVRLAFVNAHDRESNYLDVCISFCITIHAILWLNRGISPFFDSKKWFVVHFKPFDCPNISSILILPIRNPSEIENIKQGLRAVYSVNKPLYTEYNAAKVQKIKLTDALKCFYWSELIWFISLIEFPLQLIPICMPIIHCRSLLYTYYLCIDTSDENTSTAHRQHTHTHRSQKPNKRTKYVLLLWFELLFRQ